MSAKDAAIGAKLREFKFYTILLIGLSYSIEGLRALSLEVIGQICMFIQGYTVKFELIPFLLQTNILSTIGLAKAGGIDLETLETGKFRSLSGFVLISQSAEIESFKGSNSLANGDHPTSKRSRDEGAIDPTAGPLQKRARKYTEAQAEVPVTAKTRTYSQHHSGMVWLIIYYTT
ncbi:unnamed protein product [Fusarium langsethiae]|nr:unnamed protein product [Fusarium langsethiae]